MTPAPKLGASACVWREGRVLIVRRAKPPYQWSLPGGAVEFGETALAAAGRELLEETGVVADLKHFVGLYEIIVPGFHYAVACYGGPWIEGAARASSDAQEALWALPSEIDALDFTPNAPAAIARAASLMGIA